MLRRRDDEGEWNLDRRRVQDDTEAFRVGGLVLLLFRVMILVRRRVYADYAQVVALMMMEVRVVIKLISSPVLEELLGVMMVMVVVKVYRTAVGNNVRRHRFSAAIK